jgi:hypothetical protein
MSQGHTSAEEHWQELLVFVAGKRIVGIAPSDDDADFDLIFDDGTRLELYAPTKPSEEEGEEQPFISWVVSEDGEESEVG